MCGHDYTLRLSNNKAQIVATGIQRVNVLVMFKIDRGSEDPMYIVTRNQLAARTGHERDEMLEEIRKLHSLHYGPESCISQAAGLVTLVGDDTHPHHLFTYVDSIIEPTREEYAALMGMTQEDMDEIDPEYFDPFILDGPVLRRLFKLDGNTTSKKHLH